MVTATVAATALLGLVGAAPLSWADGGAGAPPPERAASEDEIQPLDPDAADAEIAEARVLDKALCRKRGCCVTKSEDAGRDSKGRALSVVTVDGSGAACLAPAAQQPEPFGSGVLDREPSPFKHRKNAAAGWRDATARLANPDGEPDDYPESGDCRPFEFHLIVRDKGTVRGRQLLSQACNDGHGTAGPGDDLIQVDAKARTFTHTQSGGSAWRGDHSVTVGLDPLRIARVETSSFWAGDADGSWQSTEWSWDRFSGDKTWAVADCGPQGRGAAPPKPAAVPRKKIRGLLIPRVTLPGTFVRDGWRTTGLGECAINVDGADRGFLVQGTAGKPADASVRVVLSRDDVLFVEVTDDRWVDKARDWTREDHVEVWLGEPAINGADQSCGGPPRGARQWGIRVADGAVFPGWGTPPGLVGVEAARTRRLSRLKIPLGVDRAGGSIGIARLTVVYADSDGGPRPRRLLATSELERGRSETLGDVWEVDPAQAVCIETGKGKRKTLVVSRTPLRPRPNQPVGQP
jgi:hypothetical protein